MRPFKTLRNYSAFASFLGVRGAWLGLVSDPRLDGGTESPDTNPNPALPHPHIPNDEACVKHLEPGVHFQKKACHQENP